MRHPSAAALPTRSQPLAFRAQLSWCPRVPSTAEHPHRVSCRSLRMRVPSFASLGAADASAARARIGRASSPIHSYRWKPPGRPHAPQRRHARSAHTVHAVELVDPLQRRLADPRAPGGLAHLVAPDSIGRQRGLAVEKRSASRLYHANGAPAGIATQRAGSAARGSKLLLIELELDPAHQQGRARCAVLGTWLESPATDRFDRCTVEHMPRL